MEIIRTLQPTIIKSNDLYFVVLEKSIIDNDGYSEFVDAMKAAFGLYYTLNLSYPPKFSKVLEFIQRFFLKIHPDSGTKSKKSGNSKNAVFTLINKLKKIDSQNKN